MSKKRSENTTLPSEQNEPAVVKFDRPSDPFSLENSRWYNLMKCGLACKNAKADAAIIIERTRNLGRFEYEPTLGKELADAETALTEALFAIQVARAEYERITKPTLQAAE